MLKKLFLWSLYAAFLGLLLGGAAYRTSVRLAGSDSNQAGRNAQGGQLSRTTTTGLDAGLQADPGHTFISLEGAVVDVSDQALSVQLADGQVIEVSRRAWRYAQGLGFTLQLHDPVRLEGFYENGDFEVARITDLLYGRSVSLRDDSGHPLWSGNH